MTNRGVKIFRPNLQVAMGNNSTTSPMISDQANSTQASEDSEDFKVSESSPARSISLIDVNEIKINENHCGFTYNRFEKTERLSRSGLNFQSSDKETFLTFQDIENKIKSRYTSPARYVSIGWNINIDSKNDPESCNLDRFKVATNNSASRSAFKSYLTNLANNIDPSQILSEGGLYNYFYVGTDLVDTNLDFKFFNEVVSSINFSSFAFENQEQKELKEKELIAHAKKAYIDDSEEVKIDRQLNDAFLSYLKQSNKNFTDIPKNNYIKKIRDISHSLTFSSVCFNKIIKASLFSKSSIYADELLAYDNVSQRLAENVRGAINSEQVNSGDFETQIGSSFLYDYTVLDNNTPGSTPNPPGVVHTGFLIEKTEFNPATGEEVRLDPIIRSYNQTRFIDTDVSYGKTYIYKIKSLFLLEYDCITDGVNEYLRSCFVIASKGVTRVQKCVEYEAPKPPQSLKFKYDHNIKGLKITWSFPPNPQADIKYFQVFKRASIEEPFTLIKYYDFDDTIGVKSKGRESPAKNSYKRLENNNGQTYTSTICVDYDYNMNSDEIYSVGCADAHGHISNLSAQFRVKYNKKTRKVDVKLVSRANAPRQYPNVYIENDLFIDAIKVSGKNRLTVYLDPDAYKTISQAPGLINNDLPPQRFLSTSDQGNPTYKIQFVNTDLQKNNVLNISINNRITDVQQIAPHLDPNNLSFTQTKST